MSKGTITDESNYLIEKSGDIHPSLFFNMPPHKLSLLIFLQMIRSKLSYTQQGFERLYRIKLHNKWV